MNIQDLKTEGGYVFDEVAYEYPEDVIQIGMLGFCGCGDPESNVTLIRNGLNLLKTHQESGFRYPDFESQTIAIFGNQQSANFFWYWADKEEYTEHGGSIPGRLTQKGEDLLETINSFLSL